MGYQESLVYLTPQRLFNKMVRKCDGVKKSGYYNLMGAVPLSVVTLKQPLDGMPNGTQLLWVCGDRGFHNEMGVFNGKLGIAKEYDLRFIPVEEIFDMDKSYRREGISFGSKKDPTSNEYLKRESFVRYNNRLESRENEER
jgi:hypothetical protein